MAITGFTDEQFRQLLEHLKGSNQNGNKFTDTMNKRIPEFEGKNFQDWKFKVLTAAGAECADHPKFLNWCAARTEEITEETYGEQSFVDVLGPLERQLPP